MPANLSKRLQELEDRDNPAGRVRTCWKGHEPDDLGPNDTLYVLSWIDEGEDDDDA